MGQHSARSAALTAAAGSDDHQCLDSPSPVLSNQITFNEHVTNAHACTND